MAGATVTSRAGRQGTKQIDVGQTFEKIPWAHRAGLHEVLVRVEREAGTHEHIEHIMDQGFGFSEWQVSMPGQRAGKVRVAAMMILRVLQQAIRIGIAARPDDIMNTGTVGIPAIPVQRVFGNGGQRAQVRQSAPEPVASADVGGMECSGLAAEKAFAQIVAMPEVQVANLRTFGADNAKEVPGRHLKAFGLTGLDA